MNYPIFTSSFFAISGNGSPPRDVAEKRTEYSPLKIEFLREKQSFRLRKTSNDRVASVKNCASKYKHISVFIRANSNEQIYFEKFRFAVSHQKYFEKEKGITCGKLTFENESASLKNQNKLEQVSSSILIFYCNILFQWAIDILAKYFANKWLRQHKNLQLKFRYKHFQFSVSIFKLLSVKFQ